MYLIKNQQRSGFGASLVQCHHIFHIRHDDAGFGLHRFCQHAGRFAVDPPEVVVIIKTKKFDVGQQRAVGIFELFVAQHAVGAMGAAVVAVGVANEAGAACYAFGEF